MHFALLLEAAGQLRGKKINNIIHYENISNPYPHCIYESSFKWFSVSDDKLVCDHYLMFVMPGNIFFNTCYNT